MLWGFDISRHIHDDVIKRKYFPRYWPFVRGIHLLPVNSPNKGQWHAALNFFDLRLNKRLSKQSCGWWFETPLVHCNAGSLSTKHGSIMSVYPLRTFIMTTQNWRNKTKLLHISSHIRYSFRYIVHPGCQYFPMLLADIQHDFSITFDIFLLRFFSRHITSVIVELELSFVSSLLFSNHNPLNRWQTSRVGVHICQDAVSLVEKFVFRIVPSFWNCVNHISTPYDSSYSQSCGFESLHLDKTFSRILKWALFISSQVT